MSIPNIPQVQMTKSLSWVRLFWRALTVIVLFAVANVCTYEMSGFFQRDRAYAQLVSEIALHKQVRIVFAGDSHFGVPLDDYLNGNRAGPAYSVAYGGDSLRECYAKVRRVLAIAPSIDTLILTADPHMFGTGRLESSNRSFADRYFLQAWDRSGLPHGAWSAILQQVPLFNEDFLQYLRKELSVLLTRSARHARAEGDPLAWSRLTDAERMQSAIETGREDHDGIGTVDQPFTWYARILDLARAKHVRVIGVRFPVHAGYSAQAPADKVAEIDAFLMSHGVSQIIDLRDALTDPRYFEDPDHVNEIGVAPLVTILERRLQQPLR